MFSKQSAENKNAPKAAPTAQGAGIASQTAYATHEAYSAATCYRKRQVVHADGPTGRFAVIGQTARTLDALVECGPAGVTALEVNSWAYRLGAYIHTLRHDFDLSIETVREDHDGGWHARYVLHSPVTIAEARP